MPCAYDTHVTSECPAINVQANVNEIMAGSVVYIGQVPVDRPCTSWNNSRHLRHFSVLRKMDNQPFPTGCAHLLLHAQVIPTAAQQHDPQ